MSEGYGRVATETGPRGRNVSPSNLNGQPPARSFGNDSLVLISRVPTKRRDKEYSFAFASLVAAVVLLSFMSSPGDFSASFVAVGEAGSWASLAMIATMLGTFLGMVGSVAVYSADLRTQIMEGSLVATTFLQIIMAVIVFIADEWIVVAVLCLLSAVVGCLKYRKAKRYMAISAELVQMAIDVNFRFGASVVIFVICAGAAQCCVLLWWSASFVRLMSNDINAWVVIVGLLFCACFYWVVQFFHSLVSCVVSGCVLWYFCDADNTIDSAAASAAAGAAKHVVLYTHCAVSSSLGSVCKAAAFGPLSHIIFACLHWSREQDPFGGPLHSVLRTMVQKVLVLFEPFALRYNRLCLGYVAIYGYTMRHAADAVNREDINAIVLEDETSYTLKTIATTAAGFVAILMAMIGTREEGGSWPLFMFVCFMLAYAGVSLSLHSFRSAIDALIIAYSDSPHKFEDMNTIVFHRFFRTTELPT